MQSVQASSSIGRASVSKTEGWGFDALLACQNMDYNWQDLVVKVVAVFGGSDIVYWCVVKGRAK